MKEEKIKEMADKLPEFFKNARKESLKSPFLKKRKSIVCDCKRQKSNERDRKKYGTCRCDGFGLSYTLAIVLSNSLYQYLADASRVIKREDWGTLERHANAIREYAEADSWDLLSKEKGVKTAYLKRVKAWKEAMKWLTNNWQSLWW